MKHPGTELVRPPDLPEGGKSLSPPVHHSTAFAQEDPEQLEEVFAGREFGYVYTRLGNPTLSGLEQKLTRLEGGIGGVCAPSGMAAITGSILTLARAGDHVVASSSLFGGTYELFSKILPDYGITTTFVEATEPQQFADAVEDNTRLFFVESIGNPRLDVPDLEEISKVAADFKLPLAVDNTSATPVLMKPKEINAALAIHSTTKFINGHGNAIGGMTVDTGCFNWQNNPHLVDPHEEHGDFAFIAELRRRAYTHFGLCQSPADARDTLVGLDTLQVRINKQCQNSLELSRHLKKLPQIEEICYPGLENHPDHRVAQKQFGDKFGAIITVKLENKEKCFRCLEELEIPFNAVNIGDTRTLAIHPASTIYRNSSAEEKKLVGVTENMLRICVGLENIDDLKADFARALQEI